MSTPAWRACFYERDVVEPVGESCPEVQAAVGRPADRQLGKLVSERGEQGGATLGERGRQAPELRGPCRGAEELERGVLECPGHEVVDESQGAQGRSAGTVDPNCVQPSYARKAGLWAPDARSLCKNESGAAG